MILLPFAILLAKCQGKFVNPFTDISWKCLFPITIGGFNVTPSHKDYEDYAKTILCKCPYGKPLPTHVGIKISFWEPIRLIDVTRTPYCLVGLGGISIGTTTVKKHGVIHYKSDTTRSSFYQMHWYIYPLIYWLELLTDFTCADKGKIDIGYMTEYDVTWQDDEWSFLQHPEAGFYTSKPVQLACTVDCINSSFRDRPTNWAFWCAGCLGSLYPFTGFVEHHVGAIQASSLLVTRLLAKFHRLGISKSYPELDNFCSAAYETTLVKKLYKTHLVYPTNAPCQPLGMSDARWASKKSFPYTGEDFVYLLWKKKKCCMGPKFFDSGKEG